MNRAYALVATLQSFMNDRFEGRKDRGATAVEYGLIVGLIAVVIISAMAIFTPAITNIFTGISDELSGVFGSDGL